MYDLAISLGHNSSAVLIKDGRVLAGYEEERFTGVKSESQFPINAIDALRKRYRLPNDVDSYLGHWFIDSRLPATSNKHLNWQYLQDAFPNGVIESLSPDLTHHDSHLESAMVFAEPFEETYHCLVADGFGSFGECMSMYEVSGRKYRLLHRVFGFEKSMGMLYQYATAFMGMKMHNHEYKMLAYEVHLHDVLEPWEVQNLKQIAHDEAMRYVKMTHSLKLTSEFDPVTDLAALPNIQLAINKMLTRMLGDMNMLTASQHDQRIVVSWFVQHVVEMVITTYVALYHPTNLLVVGGLFYNVKLNHILANRVPGRFCAMPLAGDQGAALGVYQAHKGDLVWPETLCWGDRNLNFEGMEIPEGFYVMKEPEATAFIDHRLRTEGWINLVRGKMEFGPRALCNTSTIAIPEVRITADINRANDRTMEMPMAPVMTRDQANLHFSDCSKIHKSLEYMIVTRTYLPGEADRMRGAAHYYPEENVFTGRPQITEDPMMVHLLNRHGPLVNTSFNFHGVPIVNTEAQILDTHRKQWTAAPDLKPATVIIRS
jgi:predicted NodU family carbamoyl transferase